MVSRLREISANPIQRMLACKLILLKNDTMRCHLLMGAVPQTVLALAAPLTAVPIQPDLSRAKVLCWLHQSTGMANYICTPMRLAAVLQSSCHGVL